MSYFPEGFYRIENGFQNLHFLFTFRKVLDIIQNKF
jgi:hypothetical protein